jgi:cysteine desulfuration protein SufE
MTETIQEIEDQIVEEFSMFDDWMQKYEYIIELGKNLFLIDEKYKTDEYKVRGCQSQVWLKAYYENGKVVYKADSDAVITKGLIALLIRVLSGKQPEEILNAKLEFIDKIGMKEHLSPNRANGLVAMIGYMKKYAAFYASKNLSRN